MVKFFLLFVILLFITYVNAKIKKNWLTSSGFLLGLYLFSSFLSIFIVPIFGYTEPQQDKYWIPMFSFLFCLLFYLLPFCLFNENSVQRIKLPSDRVLDSFSSLIIVLSLFSIIFFSDSVKNIFSYGNLGEARNDLYAGELYVEVGLANTIASVGAFFYVFAIMLFFIYSIKGGHKTRSVLLLISSFSEPLHILAYVGRDGIVFWFFSFVFLLLFFYPFFSEKLKRKMKTYFFVVSVLLFLPFIAISISRFSNSDYGLFNSLISYLGQGCVNGTLFFGLEDKPYQYGSSFPLFFDLLGIEPLSVREMGSGMIEIGEWRSWTFSTFVVTLYMNLGLTGLLLLAFILAVFFINVFYGRRIVGYNKLFIYILYFQIYSQGLFYFRQFTQGGNLFILICFFLYFLFGIIQKNGKSTFIEKYN